MMVTAQILFQYIDLLWIPVALLTLNGAHKLQASLFVLICALALRLQIEFMEEIHYPQGIFHFISAPLYTRGLIVYSLFILIFLLLSYSSPKTNGFVYIAASITVFTIAFCVSTAVMVL